MFRFWPKLIALCLIAVSGYSAGPSSVSIVSGNHRFLVGSPFPATGYEPLKVLVVDEGGAPVPGATIKFVVSSPRSDVVVEGGAEYTTITDAAGLATWSGLKGLSGSSFFNVTANVVPPLASPAVFLLSQNLSLGCDLPVARLRTVSALVSSGNPVAPGATIDLVATVAVEGQAPGAFTSGEIAVMESDRIIAAKRVSASNPGRVSFQVTLPAGSYHLTSRLLDECFLWGSVSPPLVQGVLSGLGPLSNYTDMWWKSTESGWGMSVVQHASGQMFVVWYHYREDGSPQWLVIPGGVWTNPTTFTGAMYRTSGPPYTGVFDPSRVSVVPVGVASLAFSASDRGTFSWSMDGVQGIRSITRQPF